MIDTAQVRTRKRCKTYSYAFEAGLIDGKRKVIEKGGFHTKAEAYSAGVEAFNDWQHGGIGITSSKITIREYLKSWLQVMENSVTRSTIANYTYQANTISSYIGDIQLQELRPRDVDKMLQQMNKDGLAYGTMVTMKSLLHNALQYAIYPSELIPSNPATAIKVPRNAPRNVIVRHIITEEKMATLMEKYPFGHPLHVPFMLAYHTGMRVGEVLGLTWDDIDLEKGSIHIQRQLSSIRRAGAALTPPKTSSSNRLIFIDSKLLSLLKRWKVHQEALEMLEDNYSLVYADENMFIYNISEELAIHPSMKRTFLVCTDSKGCYVSRYRMIRTAHKEGINMHSFRHTHATLLAENGASAKDVAARLGQKNVNITLNTYTHVTDSMRENTRDIIESINQNNADK